MADDAIDGDGGHGHALARLRERLARAYDGRPLPIPADRALPELSRGSRIPRALPEALLEGFAWDAAGRRYADLAALHAYAARVAGSVGVMMALLMGARRPDALARACDLGVAMQLSNIARDVGEDARAGRLYLPLDWLREAGIDPERWLAAPVFDLALGSVVARLLRESDASLRPRGGRHRPAANCLPARDRCCAAALCRDRPGGGAQRTRLGRSPGGRGQVAQDRAACACLR